MRNRVGVEYDDIVKVGCDMFLTLNNFIGHLDEPPRRRTPVLGLGQPHTETRWCAERHTWNCVFVRGYLLERRNHTEQKKHLSRAQGV